MVSYAALESEEVWVDEYVAPAQQAFNSRMQSYFRLASAAIGSKGDNNHLYGRHRSYAWAVESIYCTDPSYGTVDGRDQPGDHNWLRATDIGISGKVHWDAARRLDSAVRAGKLPWVAEWFGTFDGQTVVGWYQGHPSSADDSHLFHLHVGFWNQYADNSAAMKAVGDVITGTGTGGTDMPYLVNITGQSDVWVSDGTRRRKLTAGFASLYGKLTAKLGDPIVVANDTELTYAAGPVDQPGGAGDGGLTEDQVRAIVRGELDQTQLGKLGGF